MQDETPRWWKRLDGGTVTGVLALIFSLYSIVIANRQYSDSESTALINETYATYQDINTKRLEMSEISHLVCSPAEYARVVATVRQATAAYQPAERAQAELRETAMAMYLFAQFEQTLYLHRKAAELGETQRAAFSQETLDYFTAVLLRNPRLAWLWSPSGGNLREHFEPMAQKYWDENVAAQRPKMDAVGPFGAI